jgi:hypothetical protein
MESTCRDEIVAIVAVNEEVVKNNPYPVDKAAKFAVETKFARFAVDTNDVRLAVETKFARLAVETNPLRFALEIYPADPRPITVEVS